MGDFYEQLTPFFHMLFADWDASIAFHGEMLDDIIQSEWGASASKVLDVSCGIGTQSIGLAARGYQVWASDLSPAAVKRARQEAKNRNLTIPFAVCDMRDVFSHHSGGFDVVVSAGNSVPHLLNDAEITEALEEMARCLGPGGGCIITIRQYDHEERGKGLIHPFRVYDEGDKRFVIFQVWDFEGDIYDFSMYVVEDDGYSDTLTTHVMRSDYYALSPDHLAHLMEQAGFSDVKRFDDGVTHPAIVVGTKPKRSA